MSGKCCTVIQLHLGNVKHIGLIGLHIIECRHSHGSLYNSDLSCTKPFSLPSISIHLGPPGSPTCSHMARWGDRMVATAAYGRKQCEAA